MQPKNRKRAMIFGVLISVVFSACSVGKENPPTPDNPTFTIEQTEPQPSDEPLEPTPEQPIVTNDKYQNTDPTGQVVIFWHPYTGDQEAILLEIIQAFNQLNEWNIQVVAEYQGSQDDLFDKMLTFMNTPDVPHLIVAAPHQSATYFMGEALVDLNELVYSPKWGLTSEEIDDFFPGFFGQGVFPNFGGVRLGFPTQGSMELSYFNQDWLRELGKDRPPVKPEEFKEMACAAAVQPYSGATADGRIGYKIEIDANLFSAWTFAFGGQIFDDEDNQFSFDSPEAIAAMQFIQDLKQQGCAQLVTERNADQAEFSQGTALFTIASSAALLFYQESVAAGANHNWSVIPIPHTTAGPVQHLSVRNFSIPKTNPEGQLAAWLFLKFITSPEIQVKWVSESNYLPVRASTVAGLNEYIAAHPASAAVFEMISSGITEPPAAGYDYVRDLVTESMVAISQGADVTNVLRALNTDANAYLSEQLTTIPEPPDPWKDIDPSGQTVIFWHQQPPARHAALDEIIWKFNSTNKWGITVIPQYQDDVKQKMRTLVDNPDPPNLVELFQSQTADLQLSEIFTDLRSLVESIKWGLSPQEQVDFYSGIFAHDIYPTFQNTRLGFPPHRSMVVMYYNTDWLAELRASGAIDFDGPPQNPEQFTAAACAAVDQPFSNSLAEKSLGYQINIDASSFASWTFAHGGDIFDDEINKYSYNNEAAVAAMSLLQDLFDQGCAGLTGERFGDQTDFSQGALLFSVGSTASLPFYHSAVDEAAGFHWAVAALPHTTAEPLQNVVGASFSMPKGTPESELAAWLFIKYFVSSEVLAQWVQISNYLPARAGAAGGLTDYFVANPSYTTSYELLPYALTEPAVPGYTFVSDMVAEAMSAIIYGEDVQDTLDQLNEDANLNLAEQLEQ